MQACGGAIQSSGVRQITLVHGTFVGDDPVGVVEVLKKVYPTISKSLAASIRRIIKRQADHLLADNGNFTEDYASILGEATAIPCERFHWSSENHHLGRLMGAARLASYIADVIIKKQVHSSQRILLLGHSHAGQVFALLAQLLEYEQFGYRLLEVLQDGGVDIVQLNANLATIRQISLDFTTFGCPVVYSWPDSGYYRLLHITNHRGSSHRSGGLRGILTTREGDYIQQLGILGTDAIAVTPQERKLNKKLDDLFGSGRDLKKWRENLKKRMRVSPHGKTFLINYGDESKSRIPNFVSSFFGHGIYTRYEVMLYNLRIITEYFYKHNPR